MNNIITCIILMIFMHIVDDYYLQGILASMKQRLWWKQRASEPTYRYDYIWALLMHAFSWTFMIMLPPLYLFKLSFNNIGVLIFFIVNLITQIFLNVAVNVMNNNSGIISAILLLFTLEGMLITLVNNPFRLYMPPSHESV